MDDETRQNWMLIHTLPGIEWSGRTRYAAAMFFCQRGEMSADVLEIYRICSRLDAEDPLDVLKRWEIGAEWIERMQQGDFFGR
jgi:hypothetical protein